MNLYNRSISLYSPLKLKRHWQCCLVSINTRRKTTPHKAKEVERNVGHITNDVDILQMFWGLNKIAK